MSSSAPLLAVPAQLNAQLHAPGAVAAAQSALKMAEGLVLSASSTSPVKEGVIMASAAPTASIIASAAPTAVVQQALVISTTAPTVVEVEGPITLARPEVATRRARAPRTLPAPQPILSAAECHAAAAAEGLALVRSAKSQTGFMCVRPNNSAKFPFHAIFMGSRAANGRHDYLGRFASAEEAALAVARALGPEGVARELKKQEPPAPKVAKVVAAPKVAAAPKAVVPAYAVAPVNAAVVVAASRKRPLSEAFVVGNEENMPSPGPPTDVGAMLLMNFARCAAAAAARCARARKSAPRGAATRGGAT